LTADIVVNLSSCYYSVIAWATSRLFLRKDTPFQFLMQTKKALRRVKNACPCQKPVLDMYRRKLVTVMHTDAATDGLCRQARYKDSPMITPYILLHYMPRKTSETESRIYRAGSRELEKL
ncbi:hypothetical protein TNCV_2936171, partial [Trichonephila clavipes]